MVTDLRDVCCWVLKEACALLSYSALGGKIEIVIGPGATVRVVNDGPTISADKLAKLKGRFERAGPKGAPGTGLGLSIVEEIMRQAGGRLELYSPARDQSDGFEATLVFPTTPMSPSTQRHPADRPLSLARD